MPKLNKNILLKLEKTMFDKKKIKLSIEGKTYDVEVSNKFSDSNIENMIKEMLLCREYIYSDSAKIKDVPNEVLIIMLLLKHFTDIPYQEFNDDIESYLTDLIKITTLIKDLRCDDGRSMFESIIKELNSNEINRISEKIQDVTKIIVELANNEGGNIGKNI